MYMTFASIDNLNKTNNIIDFNINSKLICIVELLLYHFSMIIQFFFQLTILGLSTFSKNFIIINYIHNILVSSRSKI